jgi:hypothetical protein
VGCRGAWPLKPQAQLQKHRLLTLLPQLQPPGGPQGFWCATSCRPGHATDVMRIVQTIQQFCHQVPDEIPILCARHDLFLRHIIIPCAQAAAVYTSSWWHYLHCHNLTPLCAATFCMHMGRAAALQVADLFHNYVTPAASQLRKQVSNDPAQVR